MNMPTDITKDENALAAWQEWKDICWVRGCSSTTQVILSKLINKAFQDKFKKFDFLAEPDENWDFVSEFDNALVEYEHCEEPGFEIYYKGHYGDKNHIKKAKAWKDYTWSKVAESTDSPLKVIHGILIGPKGVINEIFNDMIEKNYIVGKKGKLYISSKSMDEDIRKNKSDEGDETITFGDMIPGENSATFESFLDRSIDPNLWASFEDSLSRAFSPIESALLLAEFFGIKIYNDAQVLSELGIKKSTANNMVNAAKGKLRRLSNRQIQFAEFLMSAQYRKNLIQWLKNRVIMENCSPTLLSILSH